VEAPGKLPSLPPRLKSCPAVHLTLTSDFDLVSRVARCDGTAVGRLSVLIQPYNAVLLHDCFVKEKEE